MHPIPLDAKSPPSVDGEVGLVKPEVEPIKNGNGDFVYYVVDLKTGVILDWSPDRRLMYDHAVDSARILHHAICVGEGLIVEGMNGGGF